MIILLEVDTEIKSPEMGTKNKCLSTLHYFGSSLSPFTSFPTPPHFPFGI